jgi:hypothetical protein
MKFPAMMTMNVLMMIVTLILAAITLQLAAKTMMLAQLNIAALPMVVFTKMLIAAILMHVPKMNVMPL